MLFDEFRALAQEMFADFEPVTIARKVATTFNPITGKSGEGGTTTILSRALLSSVRQRAADGSFYTLSQLTMSDQPVVGDIVTMNGMKLEVIGPITVEAPDGIPIVWTAVVS